MSSITFSHSLCLSDLAAKVSKATKAKIKVSKVKKSVDLPTYTSSVPSLVTLISDLCLTIRREMRFHGVESHYQGALELELQERGFMVQHEIAARIHYQKTSGETVQLPHDIRCREDLLLPREKLILELKAKGKMADKDHCQLLRYMKERKLHSDWGANTRGMLINFGDHNVEVWYMCYNGERVQRVKIMEEALPALDSFVDTFVAAVRE
jgi:GxxExxY protein